MPYAVIRGKLQYKPTRVRHVCGPKGQASRSVVVTHARVPWERQFRGHFMASSFWYDGKYVAPTVVHQGYDTYYYHYTKGHRVRSTVTAVMRHTGDK